MKKITAEAVGKWMSGKSFKLGNTTSDGTELRLFGNAIAARGSDGSVSVRDGGWQTRTTKERLNGIPGVRVNSVRGVWHLNGKPWDGRWTKVS